MKVDVRTSGKSFVALQRPSTNDVRFSGEGGFRIGVLGRGEGTSRGLKNWNKRFNVIYRRQVF